MMFRKITRDLRLFKRRPLSVGTELPNLRQVRPVSNRYGMDRGQPIDRYYIENFLAEHSGDIRGRALEIQSSGYTDRFGGSRVTQKDVLDIDAGNPQATVVADLQSADSLPSAVYDCIIFTQTLQYIYDFRAALKHLWRSLKPGGVLLGTFPSVTRMDPGARGTDYWRFTCPSAKRLFQELSPSPDLDVRTMGNVWTCFAFLTGLASHEITKEELEHNDPDFPLTVCVRAEMAG